MPFEDREIDMVKKKSEQVSGGHAYTHTNNCWMVLFLGLNVLGRLSHEKRDDDWAWAGYDACYDACAGDVRAGSGGHTCEQRRHRDGAEVPGLS